MLNFSAFHNTTSATDTFTCITLQREIFIPCFEIEYGVKVELTYIEFGSGVLQCTRAAALTGGALAAMAFQDGAHVFTTSCDNTR